MIRTHAPSDLDDDGFPAAEHGEVFGVGGEDGDGAGAAIAHGVDRGRAVVLVLGKK